jgi:hypothetical protein
MKFFNNDKKTPGPEYQHPMEERLATLLQLAGVEAEYNSDFQVFEIDIAGDNCHFRNLVYYLPGSQSIMIRSYLPLEIKDVSKIKLAELLVRINHRLQFGSLKIDLEKGNCYFETPHLLQQSILEEEVFKRLFLSNIHTADDVFVHVLNVNLGHDEPVTAALKFIE